MIRKLMFAATPVIAALAAGCSNGDYRSDERTVRSDEPTVKINPSGPERRVDVRETAVRDEPTAREPRRADEMAVGTPLQPQSVAGIPANVHAAAMKEVPDGDVTVAERYAVGNVDVFDLRINAADGPHEVKIRHDGVVLLHRRQGLIEVARTTEETESIARRP